MYKPYVFPEWQPHSLPIENSPNGMSKLLDIGRGYVYICAQADLGLDIDMLASCTTERSWYDEWKCTPIPGRDVHLFVTRLAVPTPCEDDDEWDPDAIIDTFYIAWILVEGWKVWSSISVYPNPITKDDGRYIAMKMAEDEWFRLSNAFRPYILHEVPLSNN